MKKNKTLLLVLTLLVAGTLFLFLRKQSSTINQEESEFALKDTAAITKIFLTDRSGKSILLERKKNANWILNGSEEPKPEYLNLLLRTIYKIEVKTRVAKAAYNNVIKALASTGTKCEIYLNDHIKPDKVYYVGGQTSDGNGTFMIMDDSEMPFIVEIPGASGYLTPRYSVDLESWKNTVLFRTKPENLKSLSVSYSNFPEKSFEITTSNGTYVIENKFNKYNSNEVDSIRILNYFALYRELHYESEINANKSGQIDSMMQFEPSIVIKLTTIDSKVKELYVYPMPVSENSLTQQDTLGKPLKYDLDRVFGLIKPENKKVILQHYAFDKVLRQLDDFIKEKKK